MVSIKALDAVTPGDLWREMPLEEEFWAQARERQVRLLKGLLEGALEEEQVEPLAAVRYRRTEVRQDAGWGQRSPDGLGAGLAPARQAGSG
jgi:hypothetical protein